jgi:hypothetical protein
MMMRRPSSLPMFFSLAVPPAAIGAAAPRVIFADNEPIG